MLIILNSLFIENDIFWGDWKSFLQILVKRSLGRAETGSADSQSGRSRRDILLKQYEFNLPTSSIPSSKQDLLNWSVIFGFRLLSLINLLSESKIISLT